MSKAEEYAKKYYPRMWVNKTPTSMTKVDMNEEPRRAAMLAYEQAEKDLVPAAKDLVEAVERYTQPNKGEFCHRSELLIKCNQLKKILNEMD